MIEKIKEYSIEKETSFSLQNTWLLERGLETLAVRIKRQSSNVIHHIDQAITN
ncbi:MAG: PLP-dependent transferase [Leptospiraceae bacterium]|nr:PLP-dependent transferase [Leptospiraceae bacterium]